MDDWLSELVRGRMAAEAAADPAARAWLDDAGGITLYGTIGHDAVLRPDGSVWLYHDDNDPRGEWNWRQASDRERMGALVIASERIPELRRAIPSRPVEAPDCVRCGGTGRIFESIICPECGGLGWPFDAAT
jgi:hypothetical protein